MPPLPSVATNAARAAITSARCCLYHSFSSEPPLPLFTSSECPPSLLIPRATFYPPIPKPFHDDPNTPSPPLTSLSSVRVSPRATRPAATTHDLLILLPATGLPPLPLSQHEYAKHSSPTCSHAQSHRPTRAQFTPIMWFATNRRRANNAFCQRCIIAFSHSLRLEYIPQKLNLICSVQ